MYDLLRAMMMERKIGRCGLYTQRADDEWSPVRPVVSGFAEINNWIFLFFLSLLSLFSTSADSQLFSFLLFRVGRFLSTVIIIL